ncbi:MAG: hypothetical protein ACKVVT_01195 [Dehalococcoidia bacterium]
MYSSPSVDDILEGVIVSLQNDIAPAITNPKLQATLGMMQALLQQVRQTLPVQDKLYAEEHNDMTRVLREVAAATHTATGPAADSIRGRAAALGARPDFPAPTDPETLRLAHGELSRGLVDAMKDLDVLQREGDEAADRALDIVRSHLAKRYVRDVEVLVVGQGLIGRG